jgi:ABC-type amino acid transport substrate-binding protein
MSPRPAADVQPVDRTRRRLLAGGLIAAGATGLAACTSTAPDESTGASGGGLLETIIKDKKVKVGVDLSFAPLQFKDDAGKPTGYSIQVLEAMLADLGATPEYVELPFAQLFAGQASGKFQISGIAATILPSRAQQVLFSSQPAFIESQVVLLRPGLTISSLDDLNSPDITIAVLTGSSQEASLPTLFPNATSKSLDNQAAIQDVSSGRSDASLLSEFNIAQTLEEYPELTVFNGPPAFIDINAMFMPAGEYALKAWMDNWFAYATSHGLLEAWWNTWVGDDARTLGLSTTPVRSPWVSGS